MSDEELVASDSDGVQKVIEGKHAFIYVHIKKSRQILYMHHNLRNTFTLAIF